MISLPPADRLAIEDLIHRHAWLIDQGKAGEVGNLYTEDAGLYGVGPDKNGRDAIAIWGTQRAAMTERLSRHVQTNIVIEPLSPDTARGTVILTLYRHDGPGEASASPILIGEYADLYRKDAAGRWRFAERRLSILFGHG